MSDRQIGSGCIYAILERVRLCIWAWRLPSDGIDEMLNFALDVEEFYEANANFNPIPLPLVETFPITIIENTVDESDDTNEILGWR